METNLAAFIFCGNWCVFAGLETWD